MLDKPDLMAMLKAAVPFEVELPPSTLLGCANAART
jgi:hypothetical protein